MSRKRKLKTSTLGNHVFHSLFTTICLDSTREISTLLLSRLLHKHNNNHKFLCNRINKKSNHNKSHTTISCQKYTTTFYNFTTLFLVTSIKFWQGNMFHYCCWLLFSPLFSLWNIFLNTLFIHYHNKSQFIVVVSCSFVVFPLSTRKHTISDISTQNHTLSVISSHNSFLAIIYSFCTSLTSIISNHHFLVDIPLSFLIHIPSTDTFPPLSCSSSFPLSLSSIPILSIASLNPYKEHSYSPLSLLQFNLSFSSPPSHNHVSFSSVMTPFHHPSSSNPIGCS